MRRLVPRRDAITTLREPEGGPCLAKRLNWRRRELYGSASRCAVQQSEKIIAAAKAAKAGEEEEEE